MELKRYDKPLAVEQLILHVKPDLVERWIELDHEIWTKGLAQWPGFAGKEVWVNEDRPGEVQSVVYWSDYKLWKAIDGAWLAETDQKFNELFGEGNARMVEEIHHRNQFYKVCEVVMEEGE
jgi:uncharacterized protein (TIGR03792 family)